MRDTFTFKWETFTVAEDGTGGQADLAIEFNAAAGTFSVELPKWVAVAAKMNTAIIRDHAVGDLIDAYEKACEAYQRNRLAGKRVLVVDATGDLEPMPGEKAGYVGLSYDPDVLMENGTLGRFKIPGTFQIIDDTPENRAKLDAIIASIRQAGDIMEGLRTCSNPAEYLQQIEFFDQPKVTHHESIIPESLPLDASEEDEL